MDNCIFCNIVAGQIPAKVVLDTEQVLAFRDVKPQAPTHILVVPKKHFTKVVDVGEQDMSVFVEIHRAVKQIAKEHNIENGFRLLTNNGTGAGQTVGHLHYHMLAGKLTEKII